MRIPKSGKIWLVDSGIRNTAQGIRNVTNDWDPESKFYGQRLESSAWDLESKEKNSNPRLSWIPLYGAKILAELVLENYNPGQNKWKTRDPAYPTNQGWENGAFLPFARLYA